MKAFCQRCGALLPGKDDRFYPVCTNCDLIEAQGVKSFFVSQRIVSGEASQTGLGGIPETARRNSWWAQAKALVIPREQYAGN